MLYWQYRGQPLGSVRAIGARLDEAAGWLLFCCSQADSLGAFVPQESLGCFFPYRLATLVTTPKPSFRLKCSATTTEFPSESAIDVTITAAFGTVSDSNSSTGLSSISGSFSKTLSERLCPWVSTFAFLCALLLPPPFSPPSHQAKPSAIRTACCRLPLRKAFLLTCSGFCRAIC